MAQQSRNKKSTGSGSTRRSASGTRKSTSAGSTRSRSGSRGSNAVNRSKKTAQSERTSSRVSSESYRRKKSSRKRNDGALNGNLVMIILFAVMVFLFLADFGIMGPIGNTISGFFFGLFGFPQYILPIAAVALSGWYFFSEDHETVIPRIICCILLFLAFGIICEMISHDLKSDPIYNIGDIYSRCSSGKCGGGLIAGSVAFLLYHFLKQAGTVLVLIMLILVCVVIISGKSLSELIEQARQNGFDNINDRKQRPEPEEDQDEETFEDDDADDKEAESEKYRRVREEERILRRREADEERERSRRNREARAKERADKREEALVRENEERQRALERRESERNRQESEEILRRAADSYNLSSNAIEPIPGTAASNGPSLHSPSDMSGTPNTYAAVKAEPIPAADTSRPDQGHGSRVSAEAESDTVNASVNSSANESVNAVPAHVYSMAGNLHEITVNNADYSPLTARADVLQPRTSSNASYSGIAVPVPEETAPDYDSDSFSDRIIRQSLEETLHYESSEETLSETPVKVTEASRQSDEISAASDSRADLHELSYSFPETTDDESRVMTASDSSFKAAMNPLTIEDDEPVRYGDDDQTDPADKESDITDIDQPMDPVENTPEIIGADAADSSAEHKLSDAVVSSSESPEYEEEDTPVSGTADAEITDERKNVIDDNELQEIAVERERSENVPDKNDSVFKDPQTSGYRDNTSGVVAGGGIAAAQAMRDKEDEAAKKHRDPYVFPTIDLLNEGKKTDSGETDRELQETAFNLQNTLKTFGVDVTIPQVSQGPAVTRYELLPAEGVKVSKIVSLADDIKLNLAAADIRIEAPIPGKRAIGIEVPNRSPQSVPLRDLFESALYTQSKANIRFAVGKDIGGNVVVTDITKMPHMLIAGSTGSGKSVCINTLIMSILMSYRPDEVKMIMIDPKIVELSVYNGIPHLLLPVVTDPKKASDSLKWAVAEMTDRFRKFADNSVRDIRGYNDWVRSQNDPDLPLMPRIVIIVDELADLMMVSAKEVEESICRLAQLARAAGIHLIIATQRPSVDVITGLIKANMPSRIAFAVTSGVDSRTILDMNGAEKLLGKGDMLFYPQGYPKPARIQGAFVSDDEVQKFANYLRYHNRTWCETGGDVERKIAGMSSGAAEDNAASLEGNGSESEYDEHFVEAGYLIIEKQKASIGMLQRVYKIGFNRAARIMDQLCEAGVVSADEGTKARKVLMTSNDFESFIEENGL